MRAILAIIAALAIGTGVAVAAAALDRPGARSESGSAQAAAGARACGLPPAASTGVDRVRRRATLTYQATFVSMKVDGLDVWVRGLADRVAGRRAADWVGRCGAGSDDAAAALRTLPRSSLRRVKAGLRAARRYPEAMWSDRGMTRLLPAAVRRGRVAGSPAWIFALVGPRPVDWRYAVVDDRAQVVAWQLTGHDAQRLFATTPTGGS